MTSPQNLSVLFIVQAGKKFGTGHAKRALQIAELYTDPFIWIMTDLKETEHIPNILGSIPHQINNYKEFDILKKFIEERSFNLIITDFASCPSKLANIINNVKIPVICFDNQTLGAGSEIFISTFPSKNSVQNNFKGFHYTPIREDFFLEKIPNTSIKKILITLGGSDPNHNALKIIKALKDTSYHVTLIKGPLSTYLLPEQDNLTVIENCNDLAPYFKENDLIFCGPGSTMLEALASKKYMVVVTHSLSQKIQLSSRDDITVLLGNMFLTANKIRSSIDRAFQGTLDLPQEFSFKEWWLSLSTSIADRPAECLLCGSTHKKGTIRSNTINRFCCLNCQSTYTFNLFPKKEKQDPNTFIAFNPERQQQSYKSAVLEHQEDSRRRIQIIKKILPVPNYHSYRLLDIGSEHGIFVQEANHNGFSAQGVELSDFARKLASEYLNINISDSIEKVYENGPVYNIVTIWKKLEQLDDPLSYLRTVSSLLPVGGLLAFRVPIINTSSSLFLSLTIKGGTLLAERAGFIIAHTAVFQHPSKKETFLEFYCIKKS